MTTKTYNVGIYCRLSNDDERDGESVSIENQKLLLQNYVRQRGWNEIDTYIDDGYSGTNFDRPGVKRLIEDAKAKRINVILVKDLSRFGRNYIEFGQYTDYLFPSLGCRFIALNNGIDTESTNGSTDVMCFLNLFNEFYSRDTSKKVKAVKKACAENGKFMGTYPAYGYKGNNLAHHLIQAFEPGEVSYAQAHEIGRQLADEILGGKYEYVIATHINKEHCHNHIIFCAVDFAEHKKYISNRKSYAQIRRVSDRLCRENGLSVVAPGAERGKQYAEWDAQRKGTSYKQKLKIAIDRLIPISKDLDDLLRRLEAEGYEIKRGKYISFRAPGQERFTRAKTLGEAYTEEAIAERIKGKVILKTPKPERSGVSLLIDIENCIKAQQSAGYERWAKIENLKRAARTMVFLDQHGISRYTDLEQKITELQDSNEQAAAALKTAERRLSDLALLIKHTATYKELKPLYSEYKKSRDKEKYLRGREREIILFEASARALKAAGVGDKLPDLAKLREEYSRLSEEKDRLYAEYGSLKKRMREYDAVKQNIDSILSPNRGQEQDKAL